MVDVDEIDVDPIGANVLLPFMKDLNNLQFARYTSAAGITVLLYDYILTFPEEFEYVWRGSKKITAVKLMFVWNRYFVVPWIVTYVYHFAGLRGPLSNRFCKVVVPSVALIQGISMGVGMQLLALRVLALYRNRKTVKLGLYSFLAACHIALAVLAIDVLIRISPSLMYLPFTKTCYSNTPKAAGYVYLPPLLAESAIMVLQVLHHFRSRENRLVVRTPLIHTMYRDGYLYFAAVMTVRIACFFMFALGPASLWSFGNVLDFPLTCALISRFFLQLRGAIQEEVDEEEGNESSFFPPAYLGSHQRYPYHQQRRLRTHTSLRGERTSTMRSKGTTRPTSTNEPFPLMELGLKRARDERPESGSSFVK